jgi:hypothetical protein
LIAWRWVEGDEGGEWRTLFDYSPTIHSRSIPPHSLTLSPSFLPHPALITHHTPHPSPLTPPTQDDPFAWLWPRLALAQAVLLSSTALAVYLCAVLVAVVYGLYHYRYVAVAVAVTVEVAVAVAVVVG